ncbi:MAG: dihydropteroate synthase [Desulfuromonadales bacterium]|nr:dihydropteroate synthase [Desulfuromonadales bacterium]
MILHDKGGDTPPLLLGRNCRLNLDRPLMMGILNVTPDSFYDGGWYLQSDRIIQRAGQMVDEGADLIDVGGESTRPGSTPVSEQQELDRVVPVIEALTARFECPVSIDTSKSVVACEAVKAGADFINDISGLTFDSAMTGVVADCGAGLFLMHTRGRPDQMQKNTEYKDLMRDVLAVLRSGIDKAVAAGVSLDKIAVDPGVGFGKSIDGNLEILRRLSELQSLGRPVLLGTSRKSFIGKILGCANPEGRLYGSLATIALGVAGGARIFRVHDVAATSDVARIAWAVKQGSCPDV